MSSNQQLEHTFRTIVTARAHGHCNICGRLATLDAHHRQPRAMGGVHGAHATTAHNPSNGLALCRPCHQHIDDDPHTAHTNGWLVPHPYNPTVIPAFIYTPQGHGWWLLREDGGYDYYTTGVPSV